MKKNIFLLIVITLISFSCSRKVTIELEPNIAIEQYHTYTWNKLEATKTTHPFYQSKELNQLIINEIDKGLAKKGFKQSLGSADFLVDFHIYVEEQKFQNLICPTGFYRGERYMSGLGNSIYCESPEVVNYDDGTLIIDIVDAHTTQLVWRGSMNDIIDNPSFSGDMFKKKVKLILKKFPVQKKGEISKPKTDFEKVISVK
jgi:hypothetical protein